MTTKYPKIENADELLRESCLKGIDSKYDGELRRAALIRIEEELGYVKRQGSASGYGCISCHFAYYITGSVKYPEQSFWIHMKIV